MQRNPKILVGEGKYKFGYCKFKWRINPKCNTHLDGLDTFKWRPSLKHNTHMQSHFEITQPYMQCPHSRSFRRKLIDQYAPKKLHMWDLSLFKWKSYPKCNTCILDHSKIISSFQNNMLTKVCIKVGVIDEEFHDFYFVSLNLKRGCIVSGTNSTMTIVIKLILV